MKDSVGNEIHEGAILKVFHFTGRNGRKHFMYKQVGETTELYTKIWHLPIRPFNENGYYLKQNSETLHDSVVVACTCEDHIRKNLKLSREFGR